MTGPLTIKLGGSAAQERAAVAAVARGAGPDCVIVHGGGHEVGTWSRRLGLEPRFRDGLRVTDEPTLDVAVAVLGGLVNARLVAQLAAAGRPAVGLTGTDGGLLSLRTPDPTLGRVAEVVGVAAGVLDGLIGLGLLPVIASVGADGAGVLHNINADEVAGAVAGARAGTLLLCTDVPGVLVDGAPVDELSADAAASLLEDGTAAAGMRPKLRAAIAAARAGCTVRIIDGSSADAVAAALRGEPVGTTVTAPAETAQEVTR